MNRRDFLAASSAGAFAPHQIQTTGTMATPGPAQQTRPNVIWLFGDQHRAQALSCMHDPNVLTPNIDRMSVDGVHFTQAVAGFPLCCPFRGSLLTGKYPNNCVVGHEYPLPKGQPTIAEPFKQAGYHTAWFGKWHLCGWHERNGRGAHYISTPGQRGGFDEWVGYDNNNSQWDSWVHGGTGKEAFHYRLPGYETDELTNLFIKYIRERGADKRPFFAALSVQPPHDPYVAPAEYMRRFAPAKLEMRPNVPNTPEVQDLARRELAGYYAMIENWDDNIARIRTALDATGLGVNTHIVLFSDHGDMHGSHGMYRKMNPFEEAIRIPFIISGSTPRYANRTGRFPVPLNAPDIAPTTLGLCGISKPSWMEGSDFSAFRTGTGPLPASPDSAYLQTVVPTGHANSVNKPYRGVVTKDGWKYACFEGTSYVMFNLNEDPYEQVNLAHNSRYRAERKKLIARVRQWVADTGDKFNLPED
ncbi:MAG TPA: sulfatase [Bryobacteraceae bacterium]|nr:sulfatase [Bryobacteraceae bacterium]